MKKLLLLLLIASILSCVPEYNPTDDVKDVIDRSQPVADFSFAPASPKAGQGVSFFNSSKESSFYEWNFGNGQKSTMTEPIVTYVSAGDYTVTLTAYNLSREKKHFVSKNITVQRNITKFTITKVSVDKFEKTDMYGSAWDTTSGPDIYLKLMDSGGSVLYQTSHVDNVKESNLPLSFVFNYTINSSDFYLPYYLYMYDWDGLETDDLMIIFSFNIKDYYNSLLTAIQLSEILGAYQIAITAKWE